MQLHDILLLRTSAILPEAISAGGLTPTTDTSLFLTTYRGGSHLTSDIFITGQAVYSYPLNLYTASDKAYDTSRKLLHLLLMAGLPGLR